MDDFETKRAALSALKNIGEKSAGWMIEVGVDTPEKLADVGPVETYRRMKAAYPKGMSVCGLYALEGALQGIAYVHLSKDEKERLKNELAGANAQ